MTQEHSRHVKAAILVALNAPLEVDDVTVPTPEAGQVVVRVAYSSICGKQIDEITGRRGPDPFLPHLLGHEGAGIVEAVGAGVRKVKAGDRVVMHWIKGSGIDSATPRFLRGTTPVNAGWITTFSEVTVASENRVTRVPADTRLDVACLLGCAVTTGLGIVFNDAGLKPGQSIVVFGVGGVGVNVLQGAALVNADPVVAVDVADWKLEAARGFGATAVVGAAGGAVKDALMTLSGGRGFDAAVDTTGDVRVRQLAYEVTADTGTTVFAGVPRHDDRMTIDSFPLHFGRRVIGSHGGGTRPDVDIPRYLRLYAAGKLRLDEQISHRYALKDIGEAVARVREGSAHRCLLEMS